VAMTLLNESSYLAQAVGLCALTGRRAAEIGATAKFELIEGDTTKVLFSGQLKTKDRIDISSFIIPVLGDAEKIVSTLNSIRAKKPEFINNPAMFHDAASKELNRRVKRFFPFVSDTLLSVKDLRSIYGELNFYFEDNRTIAKSKYISSILGHTEDDITTGQSYLDFYICDENYC
jgi:integrase